MLKKYIFVFIFSYLFLIIITGCNSNEVKGNIYNETFEQLVLDTSESSMYDSTDVDNSKIALFSEESMVTQQIESNQTQTLQTSDVKTPNFNFPHKGDRPVAVMIDNEGTKSLPQGGLSMAQIIYEVIVEGGETRLMPLFWDVNPDMIGPVRSSRHYFLDYAMEHDAIYVHFGWSPRAKADISALKINNINGVANGGEIFWDITNDKYNWQDSYTSMVKILGYATRTRYSNKTNKDMVFSYNNNDTPLNNTKKAYNISLKYSYYTCSYQYDEKSKVYSRFRKGEPQMERLTGEQLTAKNILIQKVKNYTIEGDDAGRQELGDVGSGKGYYITLGCVIDINWSKKSRSSKTEYKDLDGNSIVLNPGQTWIQILPLYGSVEIE